MKRLSPGMAMLCAVAFSFALVWGTLRLVIFLITR